MPYFLNPAFLSALALVSIPVLIHLIRKRKLRIVKWAAMEFLLQSQRKQKRRLRIEELILLALRILIVALAVLAFARPVMRALGLPLLGQNARIYAVIVLDNSFSMDQRGSDNKTSWDRARMYADAILTKVLKPGDSASLVLMADKPNAVVGAPSFDLHLVSTRLHQAKLSDRDTDYYAAARKVEELLKASKSPYKEVYWLTDDQNSAWASSKKEAAHTVWETVGRLARVTWLSSGAPANQRANLGVNLLPLGRELVTSHLPARVEAQVTNYGARPRTNLLIELKIDGAPSGASRISLKPYESQIVAQTPSIPQTGTHTGSIGLADPQHADNLPRDNVAPFVIRTQNQLRVLVQDMHPTSDPSKSDSFYLLNALAPGGVAESFAPHLREGEEFGSVNLRDYQSIVLTGFTTLSPGEQRALAEYVQAGGGVLLFPGSGTDPRRANAELSAAGLLPARMGGLKSLSEDAAVALNPASITNHPALTMFKETTNMNLGSARFSHYETLEPVTTSDPNDIQVMIRFTNGDPAFVERRVGLGRVILSASSAGTAWNQLPLKGSYVPLLYQIISYLSAGPTAHRNLRQDEPLLLTLPLSDANKPVRITRPDGRIVTQNSVLGANGVSFRYTDTGEAGIYKVAVAGSATRDAFAVSLPADESDLSVPADLRQTLTTAGVPAGRLELPRTPAELLASVHRSRYGAEVWRSLIWWVIGLLFLESLLAQQFGRRG